MNLDLIQRPAFKLNCVDISGTKKATLPSQKRISNIDRNIERPSFKGTEPKARTLPQTPLQAIDLDKTGKLVTLSNKTVDQLLSIKVGDPTDIEWLNEKARLELLLQARGDLTPEQIRRELEINRPLNRDQRTVTRRKGIDPDPTIPMARKLDALTKMVLEGRVESKREQAEVAGLMAKEMGDVKKLAVLNIQQFEKISEVIERIKPPTALLDFGLTARFYDKDNFDLNAGSIIFIMLTRIRKDPEFSKTDRSQNTLNSRYFVKDFTFSPTGFPSLGLRSFIAKLGRPRNRRAFIDLEQGGLVNLVQMDQIIRNRGEKVENNPLVAVTERHLQGN